MSDPAKLGIDIGSTTIKVVELTPSLRGKWKLIAAGLIATPPGNIATGPGAVAAVAQSLAKLLKEAGVKSKRAVLAIPEEQVSSHIVELPPMKESEIEQALQWQVEQYIPIPADRAVWSHEVIHKDDTGVEVLLVAAAKNLVQTYTQIVEHAGLELVAVETELMATARAIVPEATPLAVIVDIGATGTDLGIVKSGQLIFARTIPTAGSAFTRAIESGLGLDTATAEQYKNSYGFTANKLDGKLIEAMKPVLTIIATEIRKTIDFYTSKHSNESVQSVILSGGIALLPDAIGALSGMVGVEMAIGDPFAHIELNEKQTKGLGGQAPIYGVAVGLAMRPL